MGLLIRNGRGLWRLDFEEATGMDGEEDGKVWERQGMMKICVTIFMRYEVEDSEQCMGLIGFE